MNGTPVQNNVNIYVNTGDAQVQMDALTAKFETQKKSLADLMTKQAAADEARKSGNADAQKSFQSLGEQITKVEKQMNATSDAIGIQSKKLSGELAPSVMELQKSMNNLIAVQKRMGDADGGMKERAHQIEQYRAALEHTSKSAGLVAEKLKETGKESEGFMSRIKGYVLGLGAFEAIQEGVRKVVEFGKQAIEAYEKIELADKQLNSSLIETGKQGEESFTKMKQLALELEKTTIFSKTDTEKSATRLALFGLSAKQIDELIPKIQNLASTPLFNGDMEGATEKVVKGLAGTAKGLEKFGINTDVVAGDIKGNLQKISEGLSKYDGQAEVLAKSGIGRSKVMANRLNEDMAMLGEKLVIIKETIIDWATAFMDNIAPLKNEVMSLVHAIGDIYTKVKAVAVTFGLITDKGSAAALAVKGMALAFDVMSWPLRAVLKAINLMMSGVHRAIAGFVGFRLAFSEMTKFFSETSHKVFGGIGDAIKGVFTLDFNKITEGLNRSKVAFQKSGADLAEAFKHGYEATMEKFKVAGESEKEEEAPVSKTNTGNKQRNKDEDEKRRQQLEAWKKFYKELQDQQEEADNKTLAANEKELAELENKFHKEELELKNFLDQKTINNKQYEDTIKQIRLQYNEEVDAVLIKQEKEANAKRYEEAVKIQQQIFAATREIQDKALSKGEISQAEYSKRIGMIDLAEIQAKQQIAAQYSTSVEKAASDNIDLKTASAKKEDEIVKTQAEREKQVQDHIRANKKATLEAEGKDAEDSLDRKLELLKQQQEEEIKSWGDTEEAIAAIKDKYSALAAKAVQDDWQSTLKEITSMIQKVAQAATSIMNSVSQMQKNKDAVTIANEKKMTASAIKSYDAQLAGHRISQERHDKLVEAAQMAMAKKEDDLKRKQFENDKKMKTVSAAINMATGIMNALATAPTIIAGIVMAALVAATGAVEIAEIQSQQYVGSFGDGGWLGGDKHSDTSGGTVLIDRRTKNPMAMAERGEYVVPADAAAHNPDLLHRLSTDGRKGNISNLMLPANQVNTPQAISNIRNNNSNPQKSAQQTENGRTTSEGHNDTSHTETLLRQIKDIHEQTLEVHKQILKKPNTISLRHIQEAQYKQSLTTSSKGYL